jgi:hypothetical protein
MKALRWIAIVLGVHLGLVVAFESLVVVMGARQAVHGVGADADSPCHLVEAVPMTDAPTRADRRRHARSALA